MARWGERGWKNSWWRSVAGKLHNREEWKKLLRTARNRHILHMPVEWMNSSGMCNILFREEGSRKFECSWTWNCQWASGSRRSTESCCLHRQGQAVKEDILDSTDGDTTVVWKTEGKLPSDTISCPRRLESSATLLCGCQISQIGSYFSCVIALIAHEPYTEWPKKMYTLFTHQYLWNKFKWNFYFRVRV